MKQIKTTDCYLPVDGEHPNPAGDFISDDGQTMCRLEKKEGVIVLTEQEFEKEVSDRVQAVLSLVNVKPQALPNI